MNKITVRIDSSRPVFIEADADSFGQVFANMNDEEQIDTLRAMVEHMKPHRIQWDYISIALEKEENRDVREQLSVILPDIAAKDAEIARLQNNRDMFKGQVERQSLKLAEMRVALAPAVEKLASIVFDGKHHPIVAKALAALSTREPSL
ncbi:hypothetical protein [Neorhizobium sp. DAR64872/K0K18]|uniref:hypothetical protein n=1 Tax=Neorhizobium sp. DAR64872/K0K18 TaxID=3421958 RepID=UPI003D2ADB9E